MRYIFIVLLLVSFAYSIALVLLNGVEVSVDLWFNQIPTMRLGLLLLLTLVLGIVIGLLLGVQVFKVFQRHWEIKRLQQELETLKTSQFDEVATKALHYARDHVVDVHDSVADLNKTSNVTTTEQNKSPS